MIHRNAIFALALALFSLGGARTAQAHAFLDRAKPRVGSTVSSSPPAVTLTFTEAVESAFCKVEVHDGDGHALDVGALEHPKPKQLRVTLPPLSAGNYTVHWAVTSIDTHQTEGSFDFTIEAP